MSEGAQEMGYTRQGNRRYSSASSQWLQGERRLSPGQGAGEGWNRQWHTGQGLSKSPVPPPTPISWSGTRTGSGRAGARGGEHKVFQVYPGEVYTNPGARTSSSPRQERWSPRLRAGGWHQRTAGTETPAALVSRLQQHPPCQGHPSTQHPWFPSCLGDSW